MRTYDRHSHAVLPSVLVAVVSVFLAGCSASVTQGSGARTSIPVATTTLTKTVTSTAPRPRPTRSTNPARKTPPVVAGGPGTRGAVIRALEAGVAVDPNPYMGAHPNVYFETPSHNIGCYIFIDGGNVVECQIAKYNFAQPGPDCNDGAMLALDEGTGPYYDGCAQEPLAPDPYRVLPYGSSVRNGALACVSDSNGLTCGDPDTGVGFFLNRDVYTQVR